MNFLLKGFLTLVVIAIGILPAVVLHADVLPVIGQGSAPMASGVAAPPDVPDVPPPAAEPVPAVEVPVEIPEPAAPTEPTWWDWTSRPTDETTDETAIGGEDPTAPPAPTGETTEPGTTEPPEDEDEGLLGGLLGG